MVSSIMAGWCCAWTARAGLRDLASRPLHTTDLHVTLWQRRRSLYNTSHWQNEESRSQVHKCTTDQKCQDGISGPKNYDRILNILIMTTLPPCVLVYRLDSEIKSSDTAPLTGDSLIHLSLSGEGESFYDLQRYSIHFFYFFSIHQRSFYSFAFDTGPWLDIFNGVHR